MINKKNILLKKNINSSGSVDEKLQTCHYKKRYYSKLLNSLNYEVEFFIYSMTGFCINDIKMFSTIYHDWL